MKKLSRQRGEGMSVWMEQFLTVVALAYVPLVQSVSTSSLADPLSDSLRIQATMGNFLEGQFVQAVTALAQTEADSEMGSDMGIELGTSSVVASSSGDGPKNLAEYCAGPTAQEKNSEVKTGTKVMADWRGYGTKYPGVVKKKRSDGSMDILYDDGFSEKRVKASKIEKVKSEDKDEVEEEVKPRDDPACELQEYVNELKKKFGKLNDKLSDWLQAQRARVAKGKAPEPPPSMEAEAIAIEPASEEIIASAPAPAQAIPEGVQPSSDRLEKLKQQLADRDAYIEKLKAKAKENEAALRKAAGEEEVIPGSPAPAKVKTVDDLIAEYMAKIAARDEAIARLKALIRQQEQELARLGASQVSLVEIKQGVDDLSAEAEKVTQKREELKKRGKLDDELRAIVDNIIKSIRKMEDKVAELIRLEKEAEIRKKNAEEIAAKEEAEARAAAAAKAEKEGKSAKEVAKEVEKAAATAREKSEKEGKDADLKTLAAAQEMEADLQDAEKNTAELDTGLHPHGKKWWRYRYEHSYIEAVCMVFIVIFYLLWTIFTQYVKQEVHYRSLGGAAPKNKAELIAEETHGAIYVLWLEAVGEQTLVCILVFLTIWVISKTPLLGIIPELIQPTKDMRVPTEGEEYRHLALDLCTIFFFAIIFFYILMLSVAHETRNMTTALCDWENEEYTGDRKTRSASLAVMAGNAQEFNQVKKHFVDHMNHDLANCEPDSEMAKIKEFMPGGFANFPLPHYLRLNIRLTVMQMMTMTWMMWLPVVVMFVVFMCLHRYYHMGYIRIMGFFGICMLGSIIGMALRVQKAGSLIQSGVQPDGESKRTIHNKINTETVWMVTIQFALFFICYGVARTICQTWMWELHFYAVLCLTLLAIFSAILFVMIVAPAIPDFCAVMALPPYVDPVNTMMMVHVAKEVAEGRHVSSISPGAFVSSARK
jgi:hypothetical protein